MDPEPRKIRVQLCEERHVSSLVELHRAELSYTLNAVLGLRHLRRLYRAMMLSDISMVAVAMLGTELVGGATATLDLNKQMGFLIEKTPIAERFSLAVRALLHNGGATDLRELLCPGAIPLYQGRPVKADATSTVVSGAHQHAGIGRALNCFREDFFRSRGVEAYCMTTRLTNKVSQSYIRSQGAREVCIHGRDMIFVKTLV